MDPKYRRRRRELPKARMKAGNSNTCQLPTKRFLLK